MMKWFNKKKKDNKGFTLVELVIVVAILAILVGLLAPQYTKYVEKSRKSADVNNMDEIIKAVQVLAIEKGIKPEGTNTETKVTIELSNDKEPDIQGGITKEDLKDYIPNLEKAKLKSKQWGTNPKATLKIDKEGGVILESLLPVEFAQYGEETSTSGSNTSTPTETNN